MNWNRMFEIDGFILDSCESNWVMGLLPTMIFTLVKEEIEEEISIRI